MIRNRGWIPASLALSLVAAGCGWPFKQRAASALSDPARAGAAVKAIAADSGAARTALEAADKALGERPASLVQAVEIAESRVRPNVQEALRRVAAIQAAAPDLEALVSSNADAAKRIEAAEDESARQKARADDENRRWVRSMSRLALAAALAAAVAGVATVYFGLPKLGIGLAIGGAVAFAAFAFLSAVDRFYDQITYVAAGLALAAAAAGIVALLVNRLTAKAVILGGDDAKDAFPAWAAQTATGAASVQEAVSKIAAGFRIWFNRVHEAAQGGKGTWVQRAVAAIRKALGLGSKPTADG